MSAQGEIGARPTYPLAAIVGQERLILALLLCAVNPLIGGVLIRGDKGTAKTTAVRALAAVLPPGDGASPARLVNLPMGATEDRVVGTVDVAAMLGEGRTAFAPGLLAAAHEGVLYVDEINLLADHLVDVLLDAAASGVVYVERDTISASYPASFVLVGTMNPEEGQLRPQLLDRFGLSVEVAAAVDVPSRVAIIRRRLDFEAAPDAFAAAYSGATAALAARVAKARAAVRQIVPGDGALRQIARVCTSFGVEGMRADLVIARTAAAHAAWEGRTEIAPEDIELAAGLALGHRRHQDPFDSPGIDPEELAAAMAGAASAEAAGPDDGDPNDEGPNDEGPDDEGPDDGGPDGGDGGGNNTNAAPSGTTAAGPPVASRSMAVAGKAKGAPEGRRSPTIGSRGRDRGAAPAHRGQGIHLIGSVIAAASRGTAAPTLADLRSVRRDHPEGNLLVFLIDASGSMAARGRLSEVTSVVIGQLREAYAARDRVAVIVMHGGGARVLLAPTAAAHHAAHRLTTIPSGGATPIAESLEVARELISTERRREPGRRPLLMVLTDARASGGSDPAGRTAVAAARLAADLIPTVVVDCEAGRVRLGLAAALAVRLRADCIPLRALQATLGETIRVA